MKKYSINLYILFNLSLYSADGFEIRDSDIYLFFKKDPFYLCKTDPISILRDNPIQKKSCLPIPDIEDELVGDFLWKDTSQEIQIAFADKDKTKTPVRWKTNTKVYQVISLLWKHGEEKGYVELLDEKGIYSIRYVGWSALKLGRGGFEPPKP